MSKTRFAPLLLAALAGPALSAPMSPEAFREYAEGYTLYFEKDGEDWGSESFGEDGSVRWRYPGGECLDGVWTAHQGKACFYYGPGTEVLCWSLSREDDAIRAVLEGGEDAGLELTITGRDRRPLLCGEGGLDS